MNDHKSVLLLQAPVPGSHNRVVAKSSAIPPLGLGYIASVLIKNGFEVKISDMDVEDINVEQLQKILKSFRPDIVGISTTTLTFKNGLRVAKVIKKSLPDCLVCFGGPHVSVNFQDALKHPFVDIVVRGEGEITFLELCKKFIEEKEIPLEIDGTIVRSKDQILIFPIRKRIVHLDEIPFPARHLMPLHLYKIPGTILTSRGCPFSCGFCAGPIVLGHKYATRSAKNIIEEIQMCINLFNLTSFYFVDDTMTHDRDRLIEICEGLKQIKIPLLLKRKLKWTCESRVDVIDLDILGKMKEAGCTTIQFGMESGSQKLLDDLGKKITLQQIERAINLCQKVGISSVLSMVFPHPNETKETLKQTIDFIKRLYKAGVEKIVPALLTLFPGTRFMKQKEKLGLRLLTNDTDEYNLGTPVLTTRYMDKDDIINGYSRLLILTQTLGGNKIGGLTLNFDE